MQLIDADVLIEKLKTDATYSTTLDASGLLDVVIAIVKQQPTVEVVPLKPVARVMANACDNRIDAEMWAELLRRTDWGS